MQTVYLSLSLPGRFAGARFFVAENGSCGVLLTSSTARQLATFSRGRFSYPLRDTRSHEGVPRAPSV